MDVIIEDSALLPNKDKKILKVPRFQRDFTLENYRNRVKDEIVHCQWQENLQRPPLSPPGESAVFLYGAQ